jgi:hypothetical protein
LEPFLISTVYLLYKLPLFFLNQVLIIPEREIMCG